MRIVGGVARGRPLASPPGRLTRPTSDRVREAIFGVLGSLEPVVGMALDGARVVDLFAGAGGLGLEARSRGAARVAFVDHDRDAVATIKSNLATTGLDGAGISVIRADAERWLARAARCDLALCDPPYAYSTWPALLAALAPVTRLAVLETGGPLELGPGWELVKIKHYGTTVVSVARPADPPGRPGDQEGGM